jgi:hypothetical protein
VTEALRDAAAPVLAAAQELLRPGARPLDAQLRLQDALALLERIDVGARARGQATLFGAEPGRGPLVRLAFAAGDAFGPGAWPAEALRLRVPYEDWEVLPAAPPGRAEALARRLVEAGYAASQRTRTHARRAYRLDAPSPWLDGCAGRATLWLRLRLRLPVTLFRVTVNERLAFNVWADVANRAPDHHVFVAAELPAGALAPGPNLVEAELLPAAARFVLDSGCVEELALLPGPLAAWRASSPVLAAATRRPPALSPSASPAAPAGPR